ncbi:protein of unknown function (plasmid) [Cupriavidus neocaledonicus]|uniref:Uncharacterized protein n=1 Tax=Cupriavidus neocaledonicus TaxID=1040979 RepID=A0A375HTY6_9BURK|nr:hypothetical protein CBM2605_B100111 [Cupriavidus neocaledonicus]SPD60200.1 protein of unknown function [Cupriavidus neocaledonicus]
MRPTARSRASAPTRCSTCRSTTNSDDRRAASLVRLSHIGRGSAAVPVRGTPGELRKLIERDTKRYAQIVKAGKITLD